MKLRGKIIMVVKTKAWDWKIVKNDYEDKWKTPSQEVYYLINRWHKNGFDTVLDLGCGIGRHSICFAEEGFKTLAMDLSENAVVRAKQWADEKKLDINFKVADMIDLPYDDETIDAVFAYYVISHADTKGVIRILEHIKRVLKTNGEAYLTLGSKSSWGFKENWPVVDANTKIRIEDGPDNNVPHFYADPELIYDLFSDFNIIDIKQIQRVEKVNEKIKTHEHYHILVKK